MKKKIIPFALCAIIACGLTLPLAGCKNDEIPLPEWEQNVVVSTNGETVTWEDVKGAVKYEVYSADGRFAEYKLESEQTETEFSSSKKYAYYKVNAIDADGQTISTEQYSYDYDTFGKNTKVYSPADPQQAIQEDIYEFYNNRGQFSKERFAALFKPGDYNELDLLMSYYMTFSGLGQSPEDVELGKFNTKGELAGGNATCNFWCGIDNITVNSTVQWAVSQATSFRRMKVNGGMHLTDQNGKSAWGSGGFIADSVVTGTLNAGNQQQWLTRNSKWGNWVNGDINMVYVGCEGKFNDNSYVWPNRRVTNLTTTSVMSEKPYMFFDNGYYVCLPELKKESKGVSWTEEFKGDIISINDFYVARSDRDTSATLNAALRENYHILFTPGIYNLDRPLTVENEDTILMGLGLATLKLTDKNSDTGIRIADVDGVRISGIMLDAGPSSNSLMEIGEKKTGASHADNPTVLNDVYFRIGGADKGETYVDKTLIINSNDVVGDNFWVWRADHGDGVGWDVNRATNGVIVNGDNVTVYGLMVEHFQEYQTIWNGENGFVAFYQSETPYDPPEQSAWKSQWKGNTYDGWASYKVSDNVQKHTAHGLGVYYVASSRLKNVFNLDHGIELPSNAGIHVEHMAIANFLTYGGGIYHIVNEHGESLTDSKSGKKQITSFIGGTAIK